jgi:hypothetical protein
MTFIIVEFRLGNLDAGGMGDDLARTKPRFGTRGGKPPWGKRPFAHPKPRLEAAAKRTATRRVARFNFDQGALL